MVGGFGWRWSSPASMSDIVRPWVPVTSFTMPRVVTPIEVQPIAFVRVGQPSTFDFDDSFRHKATQGIGFRVNDGDDPAPITDVYTEMGRVTSDVRVENPDDADQFVVVERIDKITFRAPHSANLVQFVFRNH